MDTDPSKLDYIMKCHDDVVDCLFLANGRTVRRFQGSCRFLFSFPFVKDGPVTSVMLNDKKGSIEAPFLNMKITLDCSYRDTWIRPKH